MIIFRREKYWITFGENLVINEAILGERERGTGHQRINSVTGLTGPIQHLLSFKTKHTEEKNTKKTLLILNKILSSFCYCCFRLGAACVKWTLWTSRVMARPWWWSPTRWLQNTQCFHSNVQMVKYSNVFIQMFKCWSPTHRMFSFKNSIFNHWKRKNLTGLLWDFFPNGGPTHPNPLLIFLLIFAIFERENYRFFPGMNDWDSKSN